MRRLGPVLATVLCVSACGGSSSLSHSALVSRANSACSQADAAVSHLGAPAASFSALAHYAQQVLPISEHLVRRLSALKAASADQPALDRLVSALRTGNRGLTMLSTATSTVQTRAATQLIVGHSVPQAADALGASACATSPSA